MHQLIEDNLTCLEQGIHFLECVPPELFTSSCAVCFGSTIGGHLRHNVEHYQQFLEGIPERRVNYDARSRQLAIETEIPTALEALRSLKAALSALSLPADDSAELEILMDGGTEAHWTHSSLSRELQFLISHTIHHYALIVTIAKTLGFDGFSSDFGVAPSTLKHRSRSA